jgi:small subunit ribosomal protein S27Ae
VSEKPPAKPRKSRNLGSLYEVDAEKSTIKLKNRKCPRCGNIMAFHKTPVERWTCGSCSFTDYVKAKK